MKYPKFYELISIPTVGITGYYYIVGFTSKISSDDALFELKVGVLGWVMLIAFGLIFYTGYKAREDEEKRK